MTNLDAFNALFDSDYFETVGFVHGGAVCERTTDINQAWASYDSLKAQDPDATLTLLGVENGKQTILRND